jgi:hypothetical protein
MSETTSVLISNAAADRSQERQITEALKKNFPEADVNHMGGIGSWGVTWQGKFDDDAQVAIVTTALKDFNVSVHKNITLGIPGWDDEEGGFGMAAVDPTPTPRGPKM